MIMLQPAPTEAHTDRDPLMHAYCVVCQAAAVPDPVKAMCGMGKGKRLGETEGVWEIPDGCCVVCADLAPRPCEKCGN